MNDLATIDAFGVLIEPTALTLRRVLPGPIERAWAYLTVSDLRRQWLAAGEMTLAAGAPFELVWRNHELTDPPSALPEGFAEEARMQSRIVAVDPPRLLSIQWAGGGDVTFELSPQGSDVLLTVTHRRLPDRSATLMFGAGWHMHLDTLVARITSTAPAPFWQGWKRLHAEYDLRIPG